MRADLMALTCENSLKLKKLAQGLCRENIWCKSVAGFRFDDRQMGKVQSGNVDYADDKSRYECQTEKSRVGQIHYLDAGGGNAIFELMQRR